MIACRIARADYRLAKIKAEDPNFGYSGRTVHHGLHPLCVAAILEAGRVKGSRDVGQEFAIPGVYTCPDNDSTPWDYASRAYLRTHKQPTHSDPWPTHVVCTQFILRGHETKAGQKGIDIRSMGNDSQWIYDKEEWVIWHDLLVYIGGTPTTKSPCGVYVVPPYNGSRASTRLYRQGSVNTHYEGHWRHMKP